MCGRYRAKSTGADVEKLWRVPPNEAAERALERVEVKPTTRVAVLQTGSDAPRMEAVRWGVQPAWSKTSRPIINARSDKLSSSRLWKRLAANAAQRCLFITDGYYEWLRPEHRSSDSRAQPFLHLIDGGRLFAMAGLLDVAVVDGESVPAATIVTTDAAGEAARIHTRMPVVLPDLERQMAWLRDDLTLDDVVELCAPLGDGLAVEPTDLPSSAAPNSA
jgi:putative SOS response-associated peptidase YedK